MRNKIISIAIAVLKAASFREIQKQGYHFQKNDFYSPLNDCDFLQNNQDLWADPFEPLDINWNLTGQLEVAREVSKYVGELKDIPKNSDDSDRFFWNNDFWSNADALVQYGLCRSRKPKHVVEIGCGWSSLLLSIALEKNCTHCSVTQVEPYPRKKLMAQLPAHWKLHNTILQKVDIAIFDNLEPGDILFYDGSHCSKIASDVNWLFFRILPRLKAGILIHFHDICFPYEYPTSWIFERGQTWNEQYVLQAFLMNNSDYKILIANRYLWAHHEDVLDVLYKGIQPSYGSSFWIEKLISKEPVVYS